MPAEDHEDSQEQTTDPKTESRRVKHVTTACINCRRAKAKCDGNTPCQRCVTKAVACLVNGDNDGRRGRKRALEELHLEADALQTLLGSLRSPNPASVQSLLKLIRDHRPLDEIIDQARSVETSSERDVRTRRSVLDVASLIEEPPIRVPARPWTNITDDDLAVSHLVSVYFTWQHHGYPSVDRELFVKHMNSADTSSQFCTPILVHSILLAACVYTDHPLAFADPNEPSTRGLHFLEELNRLWASDKGSVLLCDLQALPPYICGVVVLGKDRVGMDLASQCTYMGTELAIQAKKARKHKPQSSDSSDYQRSCSYAFWAAFLVQTELSIAWSKPLNVLESPRHFPFATESLHAQKTWRPYPRTHPAIPIFPAIVDKKRFELFVVVSDLASVLLSSTPNDSPLPGCQTIDRETRLERLNDISTHLNDWHRQLPPEACLGEHGDSNIAGPVFDLHLAYTSFQIVTASLTLQATDPASVSKTALEEGIVSLCLHVASLIGRIQQSIGLVYLSISVPHAASTSAYNLLPFLRRSEAKDAFHMVILALLATHQRWRIAHGVVRMLWIEICQQDLVSFLSESTISLLKLCAVENWGPEDHRLFEQCAYPNYAVAREKGTILAEMGELLDEYSELYLRD